MYPMGPEGFNCFHIHETQNQNNIMLAEVTQTL